ncbi:CYTH domain-containing protein [Patiriisocius marinistellae]|uniref:CYTH domain-containing protein n=1 Tax=Patiriisocius marinistellae TaxID=2494560 RepID=A0A5J4FY49_9FLAO|nr:CYTH domain-containing protein [Patiriisocius marinistellae]GEQ84975.1 CYTH domain-containing protein [Patiriisocius marinistellae]
MQEIERKFLVQDDSYKRESFSKKRIIQGFLNTHKERTVRVRIKGLKGFLTIKGKSNKAGTTRFEWEKEIPVVEAEALLKICEDGVIEKTRHEINVGKHIFEVDEFFGNNHGLTIAEIELTAENEIFKKPKWLGKEVTGSIKYYNSQLSINPFKNWK